jgi:hypothetical protein
VDFNKHSLIKIDKPHDRALFDPRGIILAIFEEDH